MTRPIGFIAALDFETWPAARVVETLLGAGYDGVEWTPAHGEELHAPALGYASQQDLVTRGADAVATTIDHLERAHDAAIPIVTLLTGPNLWEDGARPRDDEQAWSTALAALDEIARRATTLGVRIALEPCWGTLAHDAATARRVLAAVPVDITFDPSHFAVAGDDIPALVREWGSRIAHVHLKDAFGAPGIEGTDFHFCLLGEGVVPWPAFLTALDEIGYDGALSVEFEAYRYYEQILGGDPAAAATLARAQVAALLRRAP